MILGRTWKDRELLLVFALSLLGWAIIGGLFVYVFEPQWQDGEERIAQEIETTIITYGADKELSGGAIVCAHFSEGKWISGEIPNYRIWTLRLAFPEDLLTPMDVDLAIDENRFTITGYRYEAFEVNVVTGGRRPTPYPSPRFDVVAWEVETPYATGRRKTTGSKTNVLHGNTDPIAYRTAAPDHAPDVFRELEVSNDRRCGGSDEDSWLHIGL